MCLVGPMEKQMRVLVERMANSGINIDMEMSDGDMIGAALLVTE